MQTNRLIITLLFFILIITTGKTVITEQEAIEISKQSPLVQDLLKNNPDAKPTVSVREYQNKTIFDVFWWTKETPEKLHHPDLLVSIDAETGEILFEGAAKNGWKEEPTWEEELEFP